MSDTERSEEPRLKRIPFTHQDHKTLLAMCNAMRVAAAANVVATLINTFVSMQSENAGGMVGVLIQAAFAALLFTSASHFQKVAETDDDDQRHVAEGLEQLRVLFLLKGALVIVGITLAVLIVPIMIVAGALGAFAAAS